MTGTDALFAAALQQLGSKPPDAASAREKGRYSERMSQVLAIVLGQGFRERGLAETRPAAPGVLGGSGAERRLSGGLGAKRVDVSWSTEESGLLLGVSIKTINFKDRTTKNFQKNLTNRRGDMLFEAVTLHQRFPYAVLIGFLCLDAGAEKDSTQKRRSTFANVHPRLRLFTGRNDPAGRNEQFEHFYVALVNAKQPLPAGGFFALAILKLRFPSTSFSLSVYPASKDEIQTSIRSSTGVWSRQTSFTSILKLSRPLPSAIPPPHLLL